MVLVHLQQEQEHRVEEGEPEEGLGEGLVESMHSGFAAMVVDYSSTVADEE